MSTPAVAEPFYWTEESWGRGLRCRALDGAAAHVFTTRQLRLSSRDERDAAARSVGAERLFMVTQVHGCNVAVVRRRSDLPDLPDLPSRARGGDSGRPEADVAITDDPAVAMAVRAADCVPLLLADAKTGVVAAVHAGWRGTAAGASRVAVEALAREFGAEPADLVAVIGPSIGVCCYEVGTELVDAFAAAGHDRYLIQRWFVSPPPRRDSPRCGLSTMERQTLRLDLAGANRDQLILAGVQEENVHVAALCTAMNLDVLTSYRVEKEKAGRIAGVIRARSG